MVNPASSASSASTGVTRRYIETDLAIHDADGDTENVDSSTLVPTIEIRRTVSNNQK
jgi:hypothetical protein